MGYHKLTLRPYRTRRFNISFHSKPLEEPLKKQVPLEILIRETASTNVDSDVSNLIIEDNGYILY